MSEANTPLASIIANAVSRMAQLVANTYVEVVVSFTEDKKRSGAINEVD